MDDPRAAGAPRRHRGSRLVCLLGGMACLLGLFAGAALRSQHGSAHRSHPAAVVAIAADGHGAAARGELPLVADRAVEVSAPERSGTADPDVPVARTGFPVDSSRTRGPPTGR